MGVIKSYCDCTQDEGNEQQNKIKDYFIPIKNKVCFHDFQIQGVLGEGPFVVVFLAQLKLNIQKGINQRYVIKRIEKKALINSKISENDKLQKNILALYKCKFIVTLVMEFQDAKFMYFAMQFATGGDTYPLMRKRSPKFGQLQALGQKAIRFIAGCVILGLQCLHKNKIMYRDVKSLKPENILMFQNGYVKITYFGSSKSQNYQNHRVGKVISGTPFYYAPQVVLNDDHQKERDFWMLGVFLYQTSVLEPPFTTNQITRLDFKKACLDAESNRDWKGINLSEQLKSLINSLLKFNPSQRLGHNGWKQVKKHDFFKDFDWQSLQNMTMQSPLKALIQKYPVRIQPYQPLSPQQLKQNFWE